MRELPQRPPELFPPPLFHGKEHPGVISANARDQISVVMMRQLPRYLTSEQGKLFVQHLDVVADTFRQIG